MKKNPTKNVLTNFPYSKRHYLTHPWKFVRDCWINLKNAWYRITRGIAPMDLWSYDFHLQNQIPYALRWLADNSHSWPQSDEFVEFEDWHKYLLELADRWDYAFKDWMIECPDENEYAKEYHELTRKLMHYEETEEGIRRSWLEETPEYIALRDKYRKRELEIMEKYDTLQYECWLEFIDHFHHLWD